MKTEHTAVSICVGIIGMTTLLLGLVQILVFAGGTELTVGIMTVPNDFFRGAWGGLVVASAGALMLSGVREIGDIRQFSKVVLGAILVWIIAGCEIFAMICGSIPAGEESPAFFNSLTGFIGGFAPPYAPAVLLLPFSLVIACLIRRWGSSDT